MLQMANKKSKKASVFMCPPENKGRESMVFCTTPLFRETTLLWSDPDCVPKYSLQRIAHTSNLNLNKIMTLIFCKNVSEEVKWTPLIAKWYIKVIRMVVLLIFFTWQQKQNKNIYFTWEVFVFGQTAKKKHGEAFHLSLFASSGVQLFFFFVSVAWCSTVARMPMLWSFPVQTTADCSTKGSDRLCAPIWSQLLAELWLLSCDNNSCLHWSQPPACVLRSCQR